MLAFEKKKPESYLFQKIAFHGLLHLLGFDHKKYYDYKVMNKIEKKIYLKTIIKDKTR